MPHSVANLVHEFVGEARSGQAAVNFSLSLRERPEVI